MEILVEMIFGKGSELYTKLYKSGLINQTFSCEYSPQKDYGYTACEGESKDPEKVYEEITKHIDLLREKGLCEEDFNRIKNVVWGDYIRSFNDIESYAHTYLTLSFLDINYLDYFETYQSITFDDIKARFTEQFNNDVSVLSVVSPE